MNSEPGLDTQAGSELPSPFLDPLGTLQRRWRAVLGVAVVGIAASSSMWWILEARFYAEATVVVARQQVSRSLVEPTLQEDAIGRIDALAAEVLSRFNVTKMVEEFGLYPKVRDQETMAEIVDRVRADVTVRAEHRIEKTSGESSARVYVIGFAYEEPKAAAAVANRVADLFVDLSLAQRHRQHELTTQFLQRELESADRELREQNRAIAEYRGKHRALLPTDLQANLARLNLLQNQRQSLALQIAEAGTRIASLISEPGSSPEALLPVLRDQLAQQLATSTERHPDVVALRARIAELEAQRGAATDAPVSRSPSALLAAGEQTYALLQDQLASTERELKELDERIGRMPAVQEGIAALEEKALILRETYLDLLRKVHESELSEDLLRAQQGERISVVNRAEAPSKPTRSRALYFALGVAGALGVALALGFSLELLDPVLISAEQLVGAGAPPVLGWVGRIR